MLQIWNNMQIARYKGGFVFAACLLCAGCGTTNHGPNSGHLNAGSLISKQSFVIGGLAVGFVTNHEELPALQPYQRSRYANKLASAVLEYNLGMRGLVDSYGYVSARVGQPFGDIVQSYRREGDLGPRAMARLTAAKLRRRYLMLATISPVDEKIELPADIAPVVGSHNPDVDDYQDVSLQTVRLKAVRVQIYDAHAGVKVSETTFSSDDQNIMLATERSGTRYLGNSLLGALANSVSNRVRRSSDVAHPPAPSSEQTLDFLWRRIAQALPGAHSL